MDFVTILCMAKCDFYILGSKYKYNVECVQDKSYTKVWNI